MGALVERVALDTGRVAARRRNRQGRGRGSERRGRARDDRLVAALAALAARAAAPRPRSAAAGVPTVGASDVVLASASAELTADAPAIGEPRNLPQRAALRRYSVASCARRAQDTESVVSNKVALMNRDRRWSMNVRVNPNVHRDNHGGARWGMRA